MTVSNQLKNQHLLWRTGFGSATDKSDALSKIHTHQLYKEIEKQSLTRPVYIDVANNMVKELLKGMDSSVMMGGIREALSAEQKKQIRKQSAEDIKNLNLAWLDEMVNSDAQLREKMALFWHGHFACRDINIYYQQLLLDVIRNNALGNFGDLLHAVSKSAPMLGFLNNQQNRKQHPNENFAREVMELFTLGRGNYTEQDVKEAARAFTGWGFNLDGTFVFRKPAHDDGVKTVLGKTGNFDGDAVLDILLEQKQTARFLTNKIYRFFVNDVADEQHITLLAEGFYQSGYNIQKLMHAIFTSNWFYEERNIGAKIKSPVELLTGIRRLLPMQLENRDIQLLLQRVLGQLLFYPPNVAGWPGGKTWIDSSTLMLRLRIPQLMKDDDTFYITPKADDDQQMGMKENFEKERLVKMNGLNKGGFQIVANINWAAYSNRFSKIETEKLFDALQNIVLQTAVAPTNKNAVLAMAKNDSRDEYIKTVTIALMSTPEYQLC